MYYTSDSPLLEKVKKVRGVGFNSLGEARVLSTFDHIYHTFLLGQSTQYVVVGTLLPVLFALEIWYWAGTFGICHKL